MRPYQSDQSDHHESARLRIPSLVSRSLAVTDGVKLKIEGSFTNILNHVNLSDPQLAIDAPSFGQITSARASDFGGYRTGQVSMRLQF